MKYLFLFICITSASISSAQIDSSLLKQISHDSSRNTLNMDAMYTRPFLKTSKLPVSLGGYVEMNYQHVSTEHISDGHEFQFRRLSLFVASSISKRIKFLSEIEYEHDKDEELEGKSMEIDIEYAALDIELHPLFNLRGGIIVNPLGSFNQNHDGPKWEFTDRPIAMTQMLPATFSNAGFGLYGKRYSKNWMLGYECYLSGGLNNAIINNDHNKTYLPQAKENTARFVTSASGSPLITAKLSVRNQKIGELGVSWMGGVYNKWQNEGKVVDSKRRCDVFDIDFNTTIAHSNTKLNAEWALVFVQVPDSLSPQYGTRQQGGFIDLVQPVLKMNVLGWEHAVFNFACRLEYADWNLGLFNTSGYHIADDVWSIMPALSFRPTPQTVLRINYRYQRQRDFVGHAPVTTKGIIFGLSSYF